MDIPAQRVCLALCCFCVEIREVRRLQLLDQLHHANHGSRGGSRGFRRVDPTGNVAVRIYVFRGINLVNKCEGFVQHIIVVYPYNIREAMKRNIETLTTS